MAARGSGLATWLLVLSAISACGGSSSSGHATGGSDAGGTGTGGTSSGGMSTSGGAPSGGQSAGGTGNQAGSAGASGSAGSAGAAGSTSSGGSGGTTGGAPSGGSGGTTSGGSGGTTGGTGGATGGTGGVTGGTGGTTGGTGGTTSGGSGGTGGTGGVEVVASIVGVQFYVNCMPIVGPDPIGGTFTARYDNSLGTASSELTVTSAKLHVSGTPADLDWTFSVRPAVSGIVAAGDTQDVVHTKVVTSGSGTGDPCSFCGRLFSLTVTWDNGGFVTYPGTLMCAF